MRREAAPEPAGWQGNARDSRADRLPVGPPLRKRGNALELRGRTHGPGRRERDQWWHPLQLSPLSTCGIGGCTPPGTWHMRQFMAGLWSGGLGCASAWLGVPG